MNASELGTRCAWCTRVKDGGNWVEETAHASWASGEQLWTHGICPECMGAYRVARVESGEELRAQ